MFTIATTFNSPRPDSYIYPQSVYSLKCPQIHCTHITLRLASLKFTLKEYAADTVTCAFLRFRLDRHGGKFPKPTEPFNQHAPGIYNNAAQK